MPSPRKQTLNQLKVNAARQLDQLKTKMKFQKRLLHLHPRQFSAEAFEWHRTSLLTLKQLTSTSDTVIWYLNSQELYFNTVKEEVMGTLKVVEDAAGPSNTVVHSETQDTLSMIVDDHVSSSKVKRKKRILKIRQRPLVEVSPSQNDIQNENPKDRLKSGSNNNKATTKDVHRPTILDKSQDDVISKVNDSVKVVEDVVQFINIVIEKEKVISSENADLSVGSVDQTQASTVEDNLHPLVEGPLQNKEDIDSSKESLKTQPTIVEAEQHPLAPCSLLNNNHVHSSNESLASMDEGEEPDFSQDPMSENSTPNVSLHEVCNNTVTSSITPRPKIHVLDEGQNDVLELDYEDDSDDYLKF